MRLATTFLVPFFAVAAFAFSAAAFHPKRAKALNKHGSPRTAAPQPIASRQYYPQRRDLIDICVALDTSVLASVLSLLNPLDLGLHLCLCLNDLNTFLDTDVRATALSELLGGKDKLETFLRLLINDKNHGQHCTLPPHATRACVSGNPCAFNCQKPYVAVGRTCVCQYPLVECNGQCGSFPNGCGSAVPRLHKRRRIPNGTPITTLAAAQTFCKPSQSVCGIVGSENTMEFECIDTSTTLDSCGGCITPHPFFEHHRSTTKGIDCGRLAGAIGARCSNSKCTVSRCGEGWKPSHDQSECVNASLGPALAMNPSVGSLRMKREKRRDEPLADTNVVVNSDLMPLLRDLVNVVLDLGQASVDVSASFQSHSSDTSPSIDRDHTLNLIDAVITATGDIIKSPTVANVNNLVHISALLGDLLGGCDCVDILGLRSVAHYVEKVVDAALGIQKWCEHNPITVPAHTSGTSHGSSTPSPTSQNTPNNATVLGLDDLLTALGLGSIKSLTSVGVLGPGLNKPLNDLLNSLGIGPANVRPRALDHAPTNVNANTSVQVDEACLDQIKGVAMLVAKLKIKSPLLAPSLDSQSNALPVPARKSGPVQVSENLIDSIVQATANLLKSAYLSSLLDNINALIDLNSLAASTLAGCGCVNDLGLGALVEDLEKVIAATLGLRDWCAHHSVIVVPSTSGSGSPGNAPSPHPHGYDEILGTRIDLGLDSFLAALGLNIDSNIDTNVELQDSVNVLVQLVLHLRDDSTSLPPSPTSPSHAGTGIHNSPTVVTQNVVDAVLQATGSLIQVSTGSELLSNINALLEITASLGDTLSGCGCVEELGLGHLVKDLEEIVKAALAVKNLCGNQGHSGSPVSGSGSGGAEHGSHPFPSRPIILNAEDLLRSLGLDHLIKVDGIVGGLGNAVDNPVNWLLAGLGFGGRRWFWE